LVRSIVGHVLATIYRRLLWCGVAEAIPSVPRLLDLWLREPIRNIAAIHGWLLAAVVGTRPSAIRLTETAPIRSLLRLLRSIVALKRRAIAIWLLPLGLRYCCRVGQVAESHSAIALAVRLPIRRLRRPAPVNGLSILADKA
jgi:hypothetical protein